MKHHLLLLFCVLVPVEIAFPQSSDFHIEITAEPLMSNAQIVELSTLINGEGNSTTRLFTIQVSNNSDQQADDLYLDIKVFSSREGLLMQSHQRNELPFGLRAGETVTISNVDLSRQRLPNSAEPVRFNGRLTENGRNLLNRLQGVTTLPEDEYTIEITLFKRNNSVNGGLKLGSSSVTFGSELIDSDVTISLISPGESVGSGVSITNPNPVFRWDGLQQQSYRLVLVEASGGDDPEMLIEGALSTPASGSGGDDLLEYEYMDVIADGTSYTFPAFGAKQLISGKRYYWQVFTELQTTSGTRERASELWSFRFQSGQDSASAIEMDDDLRELLIPLLGVEETNRIIRNGFSLFEIELDGKVLKGEAAKEELMELLEKMKSNKIKLQN